MRAVLRVLLVVSALYGCSNTSDETAGTDSDAAVKPDDVAGADGASDADSSDSTDGSDGTEAGDGSDGAGCENDCTPVGAIRCSAASAAIESCGNVDDDACLEWTKPVACAAGESCSGGKCGMTCVDECTVAGATRCSTAGLETCGDADKDPCLEWGQAVACPVGQSCSGGVCAAGCQDECTAIGAKRCGAGGVETCGALDADECLEWGDDVPCLAAETCSAGACSGVCTDECTTPGATMCGGAGVVACGEFDADSCYEWSSTLACPEGETCSSGVCSGQCVNECDTVGARQCAGDAVQECGAFDADECLEWGTAVACDPGTTCSAGTCDALCLGECPVAGTSRCSGGGVQKCGNVDGDPCLDWGTSTPCPGGQTCSAGACAAACSNECGPAGATRCDVDGVQTCGNTDADTCFEWSNAAPCDAAESCSNGACAAACSDECPAMGATACEGDGIKTCGKYDGDNCREWSAPVACGGATTCAFGACVPGCIDECAEGQTECEGDATRSCGEGDADSCRDWLSPEACVAPTLCSSGACQEVCADECAKEGDRQCLGNAASRVCGNSDSDTCLEWALPTACAVGSACASGTCVASAGPLECAAVEGCRDGCKGDAGCALDCIGQGTVAAQAEVASLDACRAAHGCDDEVCTVYYCTTESATCAFSGSGKAECIDTLDCFDGCDDNDACVTACENAATAEAQHDLYRLLGCLALFCAPNDLACGDAATNSGGICSVEFAVCLGPNDPGASCAALTDCIGACTDGGGSTTACEDQCLPSGSIVGQSEYFSLGACAGQFECADGYCLADNCAFQVGICLSEGEGDGTCPDLITCLDGCATAPCAEDCWSETDLQDQVVYTALLLCLNESCPTGASACETQALQTACAGYLAACFN